MSSSCQAATTLILTALLSQQTSTILGKCMCPADRILVGYVKAINWGVPAIHQSNVQSPFNKSLPPGSDDEAARDGSSASRYGSLTFAPDSPPYQLPYRKQQSERLDGLMRWISRFVGSALSRNTGGAK